MFILSFQLAFKVFFIFCYKDSFQATWDPFKKQNRKLLVLTVPELAHHTFWRPHSRRLTKSSGGPHSRRITKLSGNFIRVGSPSLLATSFDSVRQTFWRPHSRRLTKPSGDLIRVGLKFTTPNFSSFGCDKNTVKTCLFT